MKISAKFNELHSTEILLHTADPYSVRELVTKHREILESVEVKQARKIKCPENKNKDEYERFQALHQHKVFLTFKKNYLPITLKINSWRIDAEMVKTMGLEPIPTAEAKESSAKMLAKLSGHYTDWS